MKRVFPPLVLALIMLLSHTPPEIQGQERRRVEIRQANSMRNLKRDGQEIRRLIGDVILVHEDVVMRCDSAYEYAGTNRFDAFSNVVITQQNRRLYGDVLNYDGLTGQGKVRGELVRMEELEDDITLITQNLDFNTGLNTVNFHSGGIVFDSLTRISSFNGLYEGNLKRFQFSGNVALQNPNALINTETLEYYTETQTSLFRGPTCIYHNDGFLFSQTGWYSELDSQALIWSESFLEHDNYMVFGDTIFYDRTQGYSYASGSVTLIDTLNRMNIYGDYATFTERNEAIEVTQNPLAFLISESADTLFVRADSLKSILIHPDSASLEHSAHPPDTTFRKLQAVGGVKFFRHDFQGVCDSLTFSTIDSVLRFYIDPVIWNQNNQMSARSINIFFRDDQIHQMQLFASAFLSSHEEGDYYNQIKGRDMEFFFRDGEIHNLNVQGSSEAVYFLRNQGAIIGVNRAESSNLSVSFSDGEVSTVTFRSKPISRIFPLHMAQTEDIIIRGFKWHIDLRPQSENDVIPSGLDIYRFQDILTKANEYRKKKRFPAETLDEIRLWGGAGIRF